MTKEYYVDPSVLLTKDMRDRYVTQDMVNYIKKQADINLMNKLEDESEVKEEWHTLDFVKVKFH